MMPRTPQWISLTTALKLVGWLDDDASQWENDRRRLQRYIQRREKKHDVVILFDQRDPGASKAKWRTTEALLRRHCSELFDANADLLTGITTRVARLESRFDDLETRLALYEAL